MRQILALAHPQWHDILHKALDAVDPLYLKQLETTRDSYPTLDLMFAAFSLPLTKTRYILFGESPYPRLQSANGYAFWDGSVDALWSQTGLSKAVNRATSLRNLIKMLLHANGDLTDDFSQAAIAKLDKTAYLQTASQLFGALIQKGFLLLNASLVFTEDKVPYHARHWRPFMSSLLEQLAQCKPDLQLILFGRIAKELPSSCLFRNLIAEHPYNLSFITNKAVLDFFKPLNLLSTYE